ncbi:MAG: CHAT domain-containing protein [Leptolyngbyaceae cyanobacterium]
MGRHRYAATLAILLWTGTVPVWAQHNSSPPRFPRPSNTTPRSEDPLAQADLLSQRAISLYEAGRYAEAIDLAEAALQIREANLGPVHIKVAQSLNDLAELHRLQGNFDVGLAMAQRALDIYETLFGPEHPDVAILLNNLALIYDEQGNYAAAEPLYLRSLQISEAALGPDHPGLANGLTNLAALYTTQSNYAAAEPLFQRALRIRETALGPDHPEVAVSLGNLAVLQQTLGHSEAALQALTRSLNIQERHLDLNLASLNDAQRQAYGTTLTNANNHVISLHLQALPDSPEAKQLAFTTLLRRKGRILDAGSDSLQALRQNLTPADQANLDALISLRQQWASLVFNPSQDSPAEYQAEIERLETAANRLEGQLARSSAAFRAETQPVDVATLQAQLPVSSVLVEYIRYRPYYGDRADRYAAYVLFPNGRTEAVDLGAAAAIDGAVNDFSDRLRDIGQSPTAASRALAALILDPIAPYLTDANHLLISPDSQLNRIPFEALRDGEGRYLVEQHLISYLNSGRDLLKFGVNEPSREPAVIVANPDYEAASDSPLPALGEGQGVRASGQRSTDLSQLQVGPLPGTAIEAEALQDLLPNATVLTEDQATENALKQVQAPRILHIATHGFFLGDLDRNPLEGSRGLGVISADSPIASPPTLIENPLLRSGLALAGFNPRSSGSEDGVLTALEASTLDLFGTQLVVLSACDTGLGDIANGEGVYGLRRAFAIAGAEAQLLSLWQVDDFGTQSLMANYYAQLLSGLGRAEALRAVQLDMLNSGNRYAHPYYWAAFIVTGDWRPLE